MNWAAVGAIAVIAQTTVLIVAVILALRQARAAVAAQQLQGIHRIHDDLAATRDERAWLYNEISVNPKDLSADEWIRLHALLTRFDAIATLCEDGIVDEELLFKSHDAMLARLWHSARPYVEDRRRRPGQQDLVNHLERLGGRAHRRLDREREADFEMWRIARDEDLRRRRMTEP